MEERNQNIDVEHRNNFSENAVLERAVRALSLVGKDDWHKLPGLLRDVACKGKPYEFQHNHLRIRYCTKDEQGVFKLHWFVTNAISGRQQYFYNKEFVNEKTGNIRWMHLAKLMRKV